MYFSHDKSQKKKKPQKTMMYANALSPSLAYNRMCLVTCVLYLLALFAEDEDSDYGSHKKLGRVSPCRVLSGTVQFPDLFQTSNLLFYERFEAYKDYLLGMYEFLCFLSSISCSKASHGSKVFCIIYQLLMTFTKCTPQPSCDHESF